MEACTTKSAVQVLRAQICSAGIACTHGKPLGSTHGCYPDGRDPVLVWYQQYSPRRIPPPILISPIIPVIPCVPVRLLRTNGLIIVTVAGNTRINERIWLTHGSGWFQASIHSISSARNIWGVDIEPGFWSAHLLRLPDEYNGNSIHVGSRRTSYYQLTVFPEELVAIVLV